MLHRPAGLDAPQACGPLGLVQVVESPDNKLTGTISFATCGRGQPPTSRSQPAPHLPAWLSLGTSARITPTHSATLPTIPSAARCRFRTPAQLHRHLPVPPPSRAEVRQSFSPLAPSRCPCLPASADHPPPRPVGLPYSSMRSEIFSYLSRYLHPWLHQGVERRSTTILYLYSDPVKR